jgi:hypothetical protein
MDRTVSSTTSEALSCQRFTVSVGTAARLETAVVKAIKPTRHNALNDSRNLILSAVLRHDLCLTEPPMPNARFTRTRKRSRGNKFGVSGGQVFDLRQHRLAAFQVVRKLAFGDSIDVAGCKIAKIPGPGAARADEVIE